MAELVTRLAAGSDVPEWLLATTPTPGCPRGYLRFAADVEIVDLPDRYLILPVHAGRIFDASPDNPHQTHAASKDVLIVSVLAGFRSIEPQLWAMQAPAAQPVPDGHRGFWARLRYVLTGR